MRDEAQRRIGHLYPDATSPDGEQLTPIAWIWARTVRSPDPAWSGHVPLVRSWILSKRPGKPKVWVEPVIHRDTQTISYEIREGGEPTQKRTVTRGNGICIATGAAIPGDYIKSEGRAGRMGQQLMAVVAQSSIGKAYCVASGGEASAADIDLPSQVPTNEVAPDPRNIWITIYGLDEWWKLFTPRQLTALTAFSDLLGEVVERVRTDAAASGLSVDGIKLRDGGRGADAYADAVVTYLAFAVDKCADYWSSICTWHNSRELMRNTFGRQAIPMSWILLSVIRCLVRLVTGWRWWIGL